MPMPFDATLKGLARDNPHAFVATFDAPTPEPVTLLNPDLSTVTMMADLVFGLGDPLREIVHIDFQSGPNAGKHRDLLTYNALLHRAHDVPVHSVLVLLRRQAAHSNQTGMISYQPRPGRGKMEFAYEIVPLWERPVEELLSGEVGTLPLAPLGQLPADVPLETGLASVIQRMVERVLRDAPPEIARTLLTAAYVLTGLRIGRHIVRRLFQGVQGMRDSDTYMAILDEGRVEGARKLLLQIGENRFGAPNEAQLAAISSLTELEQVERLGKRLLAVSNWQDLLADS